MPVLITDGGRAAAGFKGRARDCAARAIAIAVQIPYADAYQLVNQAAAGERSSAKRRGRKSSARTGVFGPTMRKVMAGLGWTWVPTMTIGSGCTVHLVASELPAGRIIVALSRHYCAVIDGVVHDTYDPNDRPATIYHQNQDPQAPIVNIPAGARRLPNGDWIVEPGPRCVYGYWHKAGA